jgi:hypothetical protein
VWVPKTADLMLTEERRITHELASQTKATWNRSGYEIIEENTLLPYYGHFLASERYLECLEGYATSGSPTKMLGMANSSITDPDLFRFCRSCAAQDIAQYGETYWRRCHQLSGVLFCTVHDEILRNTSASNRAQETASDRPQG